ncbi:MAG: hypothetical protein JO108_07275 [Acidobacteriaceae bacterium]|nr:hypothetical protein [Acidobacteriaceae bacterium]
MTMNRSCSRISTLLACGSLAFTFGLFGAQSQDREDERDMAPSGRGIGTRHSYGPQSGAFGPARPCKGCGNGIFYHGGPLILNGTKVYYIWYGNWSGNTATTILEDLANSIGGTPYFNINTTYYDGSNNHVANTVAYYSGTDAYDSYSHGTSLSDSDVQAIVANQNPTDTNSVYFVLTSADVNETSGFCKKYCGWHTNAQINGLDIKYAFVGNPDRCPKSCEAQTTSPNGNAGADGMASIIAHELEEATTDPDLNAWYDQRGEENADKCAWTFGGTSSAANGSQYNMVLGGRQYLIQQNWVNAKGGYCALSY